MPAPKSHVITTPIYETVTLELTSRNLRIDGFGRIVFDECPSDQDHLLHPLSTDEERSICRHTLENLIPAHMKNRKGTWRITFTLEPE